MPNPRIRVYAWEFPIRFSHWINFLALCGLCYTGYYIAYPFMYALSTQQYIMGWMRFIHFVSGYLLLVGLIIRIYWSFAGNRYASWRVLIPLTGRQWHDMGEAAKFYLFMKKEPPYAVGHAPLASVAYFAVFLIFLFEILTGFALYSQGAPGFFKTLLGGWLLAIMHVQTIRFWHHIMMYALLAFTIIHIYIGWYLDSAERNGVMGSIFGGYKFVTGKEWE